jgi:hypothetical protein
MTNQITGAKVAKSANVFAQKLKKKTLGGAQTRKNSENSSSQIKTFR